MPWGKKHLIGSLLYSIFGVMFMLTGEPVLVFVGIIVLVHVYILLGKTVLAQR